MKGFIVIIQLILHYLAWVGMILGIITFLFGNFNRGGELFVGGVSLMALKYFIGFVYLGLIRLFIKNNQ